MEWVRRSWRGIFLDCQKDSEEDRDQEYAIFTGKTDLAASP